MMKIYFAGPLFTPYEREYISECAKVMREHGLDPFVPHESFKPPVPPEVVETLIGRGLLTREQLQKQSAMELLRELVAKGKLDPQEFGIEVKSAPKSCFDNDFSAIQQANAMLAVVNGSEVDDGTASEIGIFYALKQSDPTKKGVVALHDDWRTLDRPGEGKGLNGFVLGCILEMGQVVHKLEDAIAQLKAWQAELEAAPGEQQGKGGGQ